MCLGQEAEASNCRTGSSCQDTSIFHVLQCEHNKRKQIKLLLHAAEGCLTCDRPVPSSVHGSWEQAGSGVQLSQQQQTRKEERDEGKGGVGEDDIHVSGAT